MRKLKERFHREHGIVSRVFSLILVLAMIMTMIPSIGGNLVKAASTPMNVTIHFMKPSNWNWTQPAVQFWTYNSIKVSNDANHGESTEVSGWNGAKAYFFSEGTATNAKGDKDYYLTVKTDATGFQFLDFQNTGNTKNPANDAKLTQYTGDTPTDVYYIAKDGSNFAYYLDAEGKTPVPELPGTETTCDLTINYKSTLGDDVAAYIYDKNENKPAGEWPGKTMTAATGHKGWYTMHLTLDNSTDYTLILNDDGHGKESGKITLPTKGKSEAEYWFDGSLSETKPADWKYITTIHYLASEMGSNVYSFVWETAASASGPGVGKVWPGEQISANTDHSG